MDMPASPKFKRVQPGGSRSPPVFTIAGPSVAGKVAARSTRNNHDRPRSRRFIVSRCQACPNFGHSGESAFDGQEPGENENCARESIRRSRQAGLPLRLLARPGPAFAKSGSAPRRSASSGPARKNRTATSVKHERAGPLTRPSSRKAEAAAVTATDGQAAMAPGWGCPAGTAARAGTRISPSGRGRSFCRSRARA